MLDGAALPDLLKRLDRYAPHAICLYMGRLDPPLQAAAPYLVALEWDDPFCDWVLEKALPQNGGIFLSSSAKFTEIRRHLRKFTKVILPDGRAVFFRFYDPRVLIPFVPSMEPDQKAEFFGPVVEYSAISESGEVFYFSRD